MAAVDYAALAKDILAKVGGEQNVTGVVHCATRLRFNLADVSKADKAAIETLDGVITVVESGGQFQVVIGNNVPKVYAGLPAALTADKTGSGDAPAGPKGNLLGRAVDLLSGIFAPILGPMCAVGILKGLLIMASTFGWISAGSTTYMILFSASDGFFLFLPMFLAVTAARKFGTNPMTGVAIAAGILYTQLANFNFKIDGETVSMPLLAYMRGGQNVDFFGLPVILQSYTSTVIPIILAVWLSSYIEKIGNKYIHESLRNFITPLLVLVIMVPLTLLTIGPLGVWIGRAIADGLLVMQNAAPWLAGAFLGAVWQVLVIFGVHWGIVPIFINNIAEFGYDAVKAPLFPAVLGQAGAALGVFLKVKSRKAKAIAGSASLSGIFGITEPAIYGVNLPRKRPFIIGCVGGAIGGMITGITGVKVYASGASSLLTLPAGFGDPMGFGSTFHWLLLATAVGFFTGMLGTYFFGFKKEDLIKDRETAAAEAHHAAAGATAVAGAATAIRSATHEQAGSVATLVDVDTEVGVPMTGTAIPLSEVKDKVFSSGAMGVGFGVVPDKGTVVSPVTGTVVVSMAHAFGLRTETGVEVLVHVGLDTVTLNGAPFSQTVEKGAQVKAGDVLTVADLDAIEEAGLDSTTVVLVTNPGDFKSVDVLAVGEVAAGDPGLIVIP